MKVLALLAALVLLPAVAAGPSFPPAEPPTDPFDAPAGPAPVEDPQPEFPIPLGDIVPSTSIALSDLCYWSPEFSFCAGDFTGLDGRGSLETFEERAPAEEPAPEVFGPEPAVEDAPEQEAMLEPEATGSEAPTPSGPSPEDATPPAVAPDGVAPAPAHARNPAMEWAVLTAAVALPWALGLKVLATLLGMRRASRAIGDGAGRPSLREAVLQAVAGQPGIRHGELVARIGRGNGTVEHHVGALLSEGRLERRRGLGSTIYFAAGALAEAEARMRLALNGRTSLRLALAVASRPGIRLAELARAVGVSAATAHYQAGKLLRAGVLREEAGPGRRLAVTAEAGPCLAGLAAEPLRPLEGQAVAANAAMA